MGEQGEEPEDFEARLARLNREIAAHHEELGRALQQARELRELMRAADRLRDARLGTPPDGANPPRGAVADGIPEQEFHSKIAEHMDGGRSRPE